MDALQAACHEQGTELRCLVEYDIGMDRCGVKTKEEVFALARHLLYAPNLIFEGIQAYAGNLAHAEDAARREAMEETGCTLKDLTFLCSQNPANGMSDCLCHVFAARVDTEDSIRDTDEVASKVWMPVEQVREMLRKNETHCGVSMLAILFALEFYRS